MADERHVADTLLHPVRLRIVQALVGRQLTTQQLKDVLSDVPQASLYRHVARLVDAGLVHVTDERVVRGGVERTYAVVESAVELGPDDVASATAEDHLRYFATFVGSLITGFERYLRSIETGRGPDGVLYEQIPLWLSDDELAEAATRWTELLEPLRAHEPGGERRRRLLSLTLFPDASVITGARVGDRPVPPPSNPDLASDVRN
ncbi:MAG TPA: helix-turn-helix domain-containing protein [Ilumatobacteraceae bacterium]|nr:helix-turn-helix domain-containing protein [Ilumatobacteraceae bacterium]